MIKATISAFFAFRKALERINTKYIMKRGIAENDKKKNIFIEYWNLPTWNASSTIHIRLLLI